MKKTYFLAFVACIALSFGFSTLLDVDKGSFTVEGKTYTPTYFFHHLPNVAGNGSSFHMQGWISKSTPNYGSYYLGVNGKSLPATGTYPLKDYSSDGEAFLMISTPEPIHKDYRAQSGSLQIVNNGITITAIFSNVPVKSDIGNFESVASGTMKIKLK